MSDRYLFVFLGQVVVATTLISLYLGHVAVANTTTLISLYLGHVAVATALISLYLGHVISLYLGHELLLLLLVFGFQRPDPRLMLHCNKEVKMYPKNEGTNYKGQIVVVG